jgi:hypothetical protein
MRNTVRLVVCLVVLSGFMAGCQREAKSRLGERAVVKGKVTVGGKATTKGTLVFVPVNPDKGDQQVGYLGSEGAYITSVFPGKYKVYLADTTVAPTRYRSEQTSDLEIDVPSSGKDNANFDLK